MVAAADMMLLFTFAARSEMDVGDIYLGEANPRP